MKTIYRKAPVFLRVTVPFAMRAVGFALFSGLFSGALLAQPILADRPLFDPQIVPPNIFFTLDASGSMTSGHPDDSQTYRASSTNSTYSDRTGRGDACYSNVIFNPLAYDPNTLYKRPYVANSSGADAQLPIIKTDNAPQNGYAAYYGLSDSSDNSYVNLTGKNYRPTGDDFYDNSNRFYPFYYNYSDTTNPTPGVCHGKNKYTLVEIKPASAEGPASYTRTTARTDCTVSGSTASCTYAQELQNFATWFSYYRTRMNVVKGGVGEAARVIDPTFRVGFQTLNGLSNNNQNGQFLRVLPFTGPDKGTWYRALYQQFPASGTPLRAATWRAGEYFRVSRSPADGTTMQDDPIQYTCQQNYHILSTDGYWNGDAAGSPVGSTDYDTRIPTIASPSGQQTLLLDVLREESGTAGLNAGNNWPAPYRLGSAQDGRGNDLSDVATYYWMNDLRPNMNNNVKAVARDGATWQHMTQFGVAFGATPAALTQDTTSPTLAFSDVDGTPNRFPNAWWYGKTNWEVDDLWRSAVTGHGRFYNVKSFNALRTGLSKLFLELAGAAASGSAAAASNSNLNSTVVSDLLYATSYVPGAWTGNVLAQRIDLNTGDVLSRSVWGGTDLQPQGAAERIALQFPAITGTEAQKNRTISTAWQGRRIFTVNSSTGNAVPFLAGNLSGTQTAALVKSGDPFTVTQAVDYLRGERVNEEDPPTIDTPDGPRLVAGNGAFRTRSSLLGDIVAGNAVVVAAPDPMALRESYNAGYIAFANANKSRTPMVYVGANDGMVHALDGRGDANGGQERWAYIPSLFFRNDFATSSNDYATTNTGLRNLVLSPNNVIPDRFQHRYYVNGKAEAYHLDFSRTQYAAGPTGWGTILVGGLGKGGKGYYAINVTNPAAVSDATSAASQFLWEFTDNGSNRMGYTYGTPLVFKANIGGSPQWVVAVASGYNNASGTGHVWLLNPNNGREIHRFDIGSGTASDPINIGHINAFMPSASVGLADSIYATDIKGRVWRLSLTNVANGGQTTVSTAVADFGKPITSMAVIAGGSYNLTDRWVVVGTGQLLDFSDITRTGPYDVYAFKDGTVNTPKPLGTAITKASLDQVALDATPSTAAPPAIGWYMTLPSREHVIEAPSIVNGTILIQANQFAQNTDPCLSSATNKLYVRDLDRGYNGMTSGSSLQIVGGITPFISKAFVDGSGKTISPQLVVITTGKSGKDGVRSDKVPLTRSENPLDFSKSSNLSYRIIYQD